MGRRGEWVWALLLLSLPTLLRGLVCTNLTFFSRQDVPVEVTFPAGTVKLRTLPGNGTLYVQERRGVAKQRVQGEEIDSVPFDVDSFNVIYYRPFPKLLSETEALPLSEFEYDLTTSSFDGSALLSETCWVRVFVSAFSETNLPFSGAAGQALAFDGADDHVHAQVYTFPSEALTISMWLRTLGRRQPGQTVLSFVSSGGREFEIRDLNDVQVLRGGNATVSARISVNDGKWHQLGVTWQVDGRVRLYVDGRLVHKTSLAAGPAIPAVGSLILGQSASVTYASARDLFRKESLATATHGSATTDAEKQLIVNRMEAMSIVRTSDAAYRERSPAFMQGVPRGCACRGGAFDHARSFEGILDEVRIYSTVRSELEMQLDMHTVLSYPSIRAVSNASLWLYYTMDSADRWSQHLRNERDLSTRVAGRDTYGDGTLGGVSGPVGRPAAPLLVDSDAPLVGAKVEHRSIQMGHTFANGSVVTHGQMQLIRLALVDFESPRRLLYARIEVLPTQGNLWQVDADGNPTEKIDRGDGRSRPLITNTDWLVLYEPVDLGQPDVYRYNDDGELVWIDTRQDMFMVRIDDKEFLPPNLINPDNPPPWISTEYILRPAWLPIPLNSTVSLEQGTSASLHLRALDLSASLERPLLLSVNDTTHGVSAVGPSLASVGELWLPEPRSCDAFASDASCSAANCTRTECGRVNLCEACAEPCREQEVLSSLEFNPAPVCTAPATTPTSSVQRSLPENMRVALLPYENACAYLYDRQRTSASFPYAPTAQCRFPAKRLPDNFASTLSNAQAATIRTQAIKLEELIMKVHVAPTFLAMGLDIMFLVTRLGQNDADLMHPLSVTSAPGTLHVKTIPVNRAPYIGRNSTFMLNVGAAANVNEPPSGAVALRAEDADADQIMFSVENFPANGSLHLPPSFAQTLPGTFPSPAKNREGLTVGAMVREVGKMSYQQPRGQQLLQGPSATPESMRLRWSVRESSKNLTDLCGSRGVEALEVTVHNAISLTSLTVHGLVPSDSPMVVYVRAGVQSFETYRIEESLTSESFTTFDPDSPATRLHKAAWQASRIYTTQHRVSIESHGRWVEVWRGRVSTIKRQADVLHITVPTVEVAGATFRVATCGAWSLGDLGNSSGSSHMRHATAVQVAGFYGSLPKRVPAGLGIYIPTRQFSGHDTFTFRASDGDLTAENTGILSANVALQYEKLRPSDHDLSVTMSSTTVIHLARSPSSWQITRLPDKGSLMLTAGGTPLAAPISGNEASQTYILFRAPDEVVDESSETTIRYRTLAPDGSYTSEAWIKINFLCSVGQELRRVLAPGRPKMCMPCLPGSFNPIKPIGGYGGRCTLCPSGKFQSATGSSSCTECPAGTITSLPGEIKCRACSPGTYSATSGGSRCGECAAGEFMPHSGASHCFSCGNGGFNVARGRSQCMACPALTRALTPRAASRLDCLCATGAFNTRGCPGTECKPCPRGATCYGGRNAPASNAGFWSDSELWLNGTEAEVWECNFRGLRDNCRGIAQYMDPLPGFLTLVSNDNVEANHVGGLGSDAALGRLMSTSGHGRDAVYQAAPLEEPRTAEQLCRMDNQLYSEALRSETGCKEGYRGRFCAACAEGHAVSLDGACDTCPTDHAVMFSFAVLPVLTALWFVGKRLVQRREAQIVFFFSAQNLATLIHWTWPMPHASRLLLALLTLCNFNPHILPWACYGVGVHWVPITALFAVLPPVCTCAIFLAGYVFRKFIYYQTSKGLSLNDVLPANLQSSSTLGKVLDQSEMSAEPVDDESSQHLDSFATGLEWERRLEDTMVRLALVICDILWVPAALSTMQLLNCRTIVDSDVMQRVRRFGASSYEVPRADLAAYPTFECWTTDHIGVFLLGILCCFFSMVAFPAYIAYQVGLAFLQEQMQEESTVRRLGDFYGAYEKKYWWWHLVVLFRRLAFVLNATVLHPNRGYFQVFQGAGVCVLSLCLSALLRPYRDNRYNAFEVVLHSGMLVLILSAIANTMTPSLARALTSYEWGPALLFWLVTLVVGGVSFAFICNLHPISPLQLPHAFTQKANKVGQKVLEALRGMAGERLETLALRGCQHLLAYLHNVKKTHPLFHRVFFPVDLPKAPERPATPPPLTDEEEYLASLGIDTTAAAQAPSRSAMQQARYDSISALKGLHWSCLHDLHVIGTAKAAGKETGQCRDSRSEDASFDPAMLLSDDSAADKNLADDSRRRTGDDRVDGWGTEQGDLQETQDAIQDVAVEAVTLRSVGEITSAWETLPAVQASDALMHPVAVRLEQQDVLREMNRCRSMDARSPLLHAHERKLNVLTSARIAQAKKEFVALSQKGYRTSAKVEQTVYLLRAVHQEIRDTDMALRAEDYRKGYLLARLGTETDLLPDEELLAKEMRDLEKQTAVLREQQQAAHAQVLRFKDTVEEELYESDSGEDEASVAAVCSLTDEQLAQAARSAAEASAGREA